MSIDTASLQAMLGEKQAGLKEVSDRMAHLENAKNEALTEAVRIQGEIRLLNQLIEKMQG